MLPKKALSHKSMLGGDDVADLQRFVGLCSMHVMFVWIFTQVYDCFVVTCRPDNVLYLLHSTQWRLIDCGIAASVGAPLTGSSSGTPCLPALLHSAR